MMISKVRLSRKAGTQGSLAKVLSAGANADRGHGLVWALFNDGTTAPRSFLYREIEPGTYMAVSEHAPRDAHGLWQIDQKPYQPTLSVGQRLGFVLRANPVVTVVQPGKPRGLRADAIMHAKSKLSAAERPKFTSKDASTIAVSWLVKRGPGLGFEIDTDATSADGYQQVRILRPGRQSAIVFSEIEFTGALTVKDPELLRQALFKGIGKARAYGCGLLLVRPIPEVDL